MNYAPKPAEILFRRVVLDQMDRQQQIEYVARYIRTRAEIMNRGGDGKPEQSTPARWYR